MIRAEDKDFYQMIGKRLKSFRKIKKLTLDETARKTGIQSCMLMKYEL